MKSLLTPLVLIVCLSGGCRDAPRETIESNRVEDPFGKRSKPTDNPFDDDHWDEMVLTDWQTEPIFQAPQIKEGDIVPCPAELAEYSLEIRAMSGSKCYYRREQSFRRFEKGRFLPSNERGVHPETLVCAMLVDGFASGSFAYRDFSPDAATVQIEWTVSQDDDEQTFVGQFDVVANQTGSVDAGNGNTFDWSFKRVTQH